MASAVKLTLRGVKEAADAFPPLKSAAAALCFILDNCEVRGLHLVNLMKYTYFS